MSCVLNSQYFVYFCFYIEIGHLTDIKKLHINLDKSFFPYLVKCWKITSNKKRPPPPTQELMVQHQQLMNIQYLMTVCPSSLQLSKDRTLF